MFKDLDPILHSQLRLAVMSLLISVKEAEFTFIREKINATDGNLSVHLKKLEEHNYISVKKEFIERKPVSRYSITEIGRKAFEDYIKKLESIIRK